MKNAAEPPTASYVEDCYRFEWPQSRIVATAERFSETSDDIRCELTVVSTDAVNGGTYYEGRLLLIGPNSLRDVAKHCDGYDPDTDWVSMIGQVRSLSKSRYRGGDPLVDLRTVGASPRARYLVEPLMYDGAISQIYGHGETAKSALALIVAVAIASARPVFGFEAEDSGPVIYVDFEDDEETHSERLRAICKGADLDVADVPIYYKRASTSLKEASRDLRRQVSELGARAVIVDSIGMACGGDPNDAGAIIATLGAARSLGVPVLAIHHLPKDAKDKGTPFGSVYANNEVRLSWHVEGVINRLGNGDSEIRNVYTCFKANRGAPSEPLRLSLRLENAGGALDTIHVSRLGFSATTDIDGGSQRYQITNYLTRTGRGTVKDIALETGIKPPRIRRILGEHPDLFVKLSDDTKEPLWGVSASEFSLPIPDRDPHRSPGSGRSDPPRPPIGPGSEPWDRDHEEPMVKQKESYWV